MLLPKVKSNVLSNPKFVSKSLMNMLGANKYIGGTYRHTSLEQQMLNQSKSSIDISSYEANKAVQNPMSASSIHTPNYDEVNNNYGPGSHGMASSSKNATTIASPQDEETLKALAELDIAEKAALAKASNISMATKLQPTAASQFLGGLSNNMMGAGLSTS